MDSRATSCRFVSALVNVTAMGASFALSPSSVAPPFLAAARVWVWMWRGGKHRVYAWELRSLEAAGARAAAWLSPRKTTEVWSAKGACHATEFTEDLRGLATAHSRSVRRAQAWDFIVRGNASMERQWRTLTHRLDQGYPGIRIDSSKVNSSRDPWDQNVPVTTLTWLLIFSYRGPASCRDT